MNDERLKAKLRRLTKVKGSKSICVALQRAGLSPRQSELLSQGDHVGSFRRKTVRAVEAVLALGEDLAS